MSSAITIPEGNSVEVTVSWFTAAGAAEAPTSVRYRVFDSAGATVSTEQNVPTPLAEMTFTIPGTDLPHSGSLPICKLTVEVEGTFSGASDIHTETLSVAVRRRNLT